MWNIAPDTDNDYLLFGYANPRKNIVNGIEIWIGNRSSFQNCLQQQTMELTLNIYALSLQRLLYEVN